MFNIGFIIEEDNRSKGRDEAIKSTQKTNKIGPQKIKLIKSHINIETQKLVF